MSGTERSGQASPLFYPALAVVVGMAGSACIRSEMFFIPVVSCACVAVLSAWLLWDEGSVRNRITMMFALLSFSAASWAFHHVRVFMARPGDVGISAPSGEVGVVGVVASFPVETRNGGYVDVDVRGIETSSGRLQSRHGCVRVGLSEEVWNQFGADLAPQTGVRFESVLSSPVGFLNPGCFDPGQHLSARGIRLSAHVKHTEFFRIITRPEPPQAGLFYIRRKCLGIIETFSIMDNTFPGVNVGDIRSVSKALLLGSRGEISPGVRTAFMESGLVHLLAISGLHVGIVAGFAAWLLKRLPGNLPGRSLILIGVIWLYAVISGGSPSVIRAAFLVSAYMTSKILLRPASMKNILSMTIIALLMFRPSWISEPGFQLTYSATFGIVLLYRGIHLRLMWVPWKWLRDSLAVAIAAQCATAPISAFWFNRFGVLSALTGLPLIPLAALALITGLSGLCLSFLPCASAIVLQIHGWLLAVLIRGAGCEADIPFVTVTTSTPSRAIAGAAAVIMVVLSHHDERGYRSLAGCVIIAMLLLCFSPGWVPDSEMMDIWFLDVGNGDCTVVRFPDGRILVVDAGGILDSEFDVGEQIVVRTLRTLGIDRVEFMAVTHPHPDHQLGVRSVLKAMKPRELWVMDRMYDNDVFQKIIALAEGENIHIRSIESRKIYDVLPLNENNRSLIMRVTYGQFRLFLPGDAEREAEAGLLDYGSALESTVLKVGHHGSRSSSSADFMRLVSPSVVVIPCGRNNQFDHPHESVLNQFFHDFPEMHVLRSDIHGMIHLRTDGHTAEVNWFVPEPPG